ncbi:MAG TPA: hypothetical protein VFI29_08410 [Hanamia sp.]|nr:hypothetical protein [Hanamia sp.]
MNKFKIEKFIPLFLSLVILTSSCRAIAGIFKAGVWVGVIGVVILVAIILRIVSKMKK